MLKVESITYGHLSRGSAKSYLNTEMVAGDRALCKGKVVFRHQGLKDFMSTVEIFFGAKKKILNLLASLFLFHLQRYWHLFADAKHQIQKECRLVAVGVRIRKVVGAKRIAWMQAFYLWTESLLQSTQV